MTQLIDMIRSVPEAAVRLWCGTHSKDLDVRPSDDGVRITYEGRSVSFPNDVYEQAKAVVRALMIRPRVLQTVQDVLEIRHDAEDLFTQMLFGRIDRPKVLFVPAGESASGYYRAMIPADIMREAGRVVSNFTMNLDLYKALRYDVLWIQLITAPVLLEIAKRAKAEGLSIVYDIDDRLDSIPSENQAHMVYGTQEKQAEIREMIALADVVTVSTEPLARHIAKEYGRALGTEVKVLHNQVTANVVPRRHPPNPKFVRILWSGSPTHKRDLAIVAPALRSIMKRHAGGVRFTCLGERIPEAIADCYDWIDIEEPVDFDLYHDRLASFAADFAIAPLERSPFNDSKSGLKALEYAGAGYPMLLSPVGEYPALVSAGLPAILVEDSDWEVQMERMIALSRENRDVIGKAGTAWTIENRCMGMSKAGRWEEIVVDLLAARKKKTEEAPK